MNPDRKSPPPPLLFFGCLLLGWGLGFLWPLPTGLPDPARLMGCGCLWLLGACLGAWGLFTFKRHGTTHEPNGVASTLLTSGPFGFSRNPLYLALTMLLAGFGLLLDSLWVLALTAVLVLLLNRLVIAGEEARLRAQFGEAYSAYVKRVRRWF